MRSILIPAAAIAFATPAHADCVTEFEAVLRGALAAGPYVMEMTADQLAIRAEYVPPLALHVVKTDRGTTTELTVIDGKAWMKMGSNWRPMADEVATQMTSAIGGAVGMIYQTDAPKCLGIQDFEGKDYLAFKYGSVHTGIATGSTLYVDPETNLPVIAVSSSTTDDDKTTHTRSTFRYDSSLSVAAPM